MAATSRSKKPSIAELLTLLQKQFGAPPLSEREEDPLLDHLLVGVMSLYAGLEGARKIVRAMSEQFLDFNEARVSPLYELEAILADHVPEEKHREAAWNLRMAMQDAWDGMHGLDLEPLRGATPTAQREFLKHLPNIPGGPAALVFQVALGDDQLAYGPLEEHLLHRLGMKPRSTTRQRARAALAKRVKPADRRRFAWLLGSAAHLYEDDLDPKHPFCKLLVRVNARELIIREQERKREEIRRLAEERRRKIEDEKRRKAEERERIKQERLEAKRLREEARKQKRADAVAKKKAAAAKKKAAMVARKKAAAAKKKAVAAKKTAAAAKKKAAMVARKKAVAAKKKASAMRKKAAAAKKSAAVKKKAAAAKKKAAAVKKKAAAKKKAFAAKKKAAAAKKKAAAAKKKAAAMRKKKFARKKTARKPAKKKTKKRARRRKR